jgi:hypothetical protein
MIIIPTVLMVYLVFLYCRKLEEVGVGCASGYLKEIYDSVIK